MPKSKTKIEEQTNQNEVLFCYLERIEALLQELVDIEHVKKQQREERYNNRFNRVDRQDTSYRPYYYRNNG